MSFLSQPTSSRTNKFTWLPNASLPNSRRLEISQGVQPSRRHQVRPRSPRLNPRFTVFDVACIALYKSYYILAGQEPATKYGTTEESSCDVMTNEEIIKPAF